MKKYFLFLLVISAIVSLTGKLYADITVESVKGEAAWKKDRVWEPLKEGMKLEEGAKISTGVKSFAVLNVNGDTLRVKQLTMMKIFSNKTNQTNKNTHIGLKYGGLRAKIQKVGTLKTSFKITTPVATSSVRGTEEDNFYGAKSGHTIEVLEGTIVAETPYGVLNYINGSYVFHLSPDAPRPENLLAALRTYYLAKVSDQNVTKDESGQNEFNGFDVFGSGSDNDFITGAGSSSINNPAFVNAHVQWPAAN